MNRRIATMVLVSALGATARAAAGGDGSVLLQQGQRLEKEGKPEMALELYKAALLVAPKDPSAHLATGRMLSKLKRCDEAVPELQAYFELAPAKAKTGPDYSDAVVKLAQCLRETQAVLEVKPSVDARCAVDGGPARDAGPTLPATFELAPGLHQVACTREGRFPANDSVALSAKEKKTLEPTLAPVHAETPAATTPPATPPTPPAPAPTPPAPAPTPLATLSPATPPPPMADAPPPDVVLPPIDGTDAPPPTPPVPPAPPTPPAPTAETTPPPAPAPPATPAPTTGEIKIEAEGRGWTCQVDGGQLLAPDVSGELYQDVAPGEHVIGCDKPGSEHVEARVALNAGEKRLVRVKAYPKVVTSNTPPPAAEGPKTPAAPLAPVHLGDVEWQFTGGFGPGLGTFGVGVGVRMDSLGVMLGTGLYPFALSGTYSFRPGQTGVYVSGGYMRISEGLLVGGSTVAGHGVWAGGGIDVRPDPNLSFKIGAGLGYNSTGTQNGPLTLDFNVAYVP